MIKIGDKDWIGQIDIELFRLQELLVDLERAKNFDFPSYRELSTAPLIVNPTPLPFALPSFVGLVIGHPRHSTGVLQTSPIELVSADGWFRSSNRLYRVERHQ